MAITVETLQGWRADFHAKDTDKDGKLSTDEYRAIFDGYGFAVGAIDKRMRKIDRNHDGEITWLEFLVVSVNHGLGRDAVSLELLQSLDDTFKSYDLDKDGRVSVDEFVRSTLPDFRSAEDAQQAAGFYDADKDGEITWEEYIAGALKQFTTR